MPKRYRNIRIRKDDNGKRYRSNSVYPEIPVNENDIYVIATGGDRYDILAQKYYGDPALWWVISSANTNTNRASLIPTPGTQIRIPFSKQEVIDSFNNLNRTR